MSTSAENPPAQMIVWCHGCNGTTGAEFDRETEEYLCGACNSSFVEELGQGVETFNAANNTEEVHEEHTQTNSTTDGNTTNNGRSDIAQQIIERLLGIDNTNRSENNQQANVLSMMQQNALESGRPVGIIINQATGNIETFEPAGGGIFSLASRNTDAQTAPLGGRGVFGLLNSLRQSGATGFDMFADALGNRQLEDIMHHILMNENSYAGVPPASTELIDSLVRKQVDETTDTTALGECSITQETFEVGDTALCLPCGHNFKEESIVQWLRMHSTCPVCRVEISSSGGA